MAYSQYAASLEYSNGDLCINNAPRQASVSVLCATSSRILNVTEVELCNYVIFVSSPFACPARA